MGTLDAGHLSLWHRVKGDTWWLLPRPCLALVCWVFSNPRALEVRTEVVLQVEGA